MACEHKRLKCVNCVIMCADCGAVLPAQCANGGSTATGAQETKPDKPGKRAARKGATKA